MRKGFTLIELLVVIAVLAVLAAGVFVAIDPVDKINAANDAKVQNDIGQIAQAMEAYAVSNNGNYATSLTVLTASGDLKVAPVPPTGYTSTNAYLLENTTGTPTAQEVHAPLKSKKYTATASFWGWCSSTGKAGTVTSAANCP